MTGDYRKYLSPFGAVSSGLVVYLIGVWVGASAEQAWHGFELSFAMSAWYVFWDRTK